MLPSMFSMERMGRRQKLKSLYESSATVVVVVVVAVANDFPPTLTPLVTVLLVVVWVVVWSDEADTAE